MDYALGEVGLRPRDFWRMTWEEYERTWRGYELRQTREWERTRQLGEWAAAFNGVDLDKELKGKRLLTLSTDRPPMTSKETNEEFLARMAAHNYFRKPTAQA